MRKALCPKLFMARLKLATATERDQRRGRRARLVPTGRQPGGLAHAFGGGSIGGQTVRLGAGQLQNVQRTTLAAEIGRVQGNRHLQTVISLLTNTPLADGPVTIRQHAPPNAIARSLVTDTEQRVGQTNVGAQWPGLSRGAFNTIMGILVPDPDHPERPIPRSEQQRVLTTLVADLGLPVGSRITVRLSDQIGSKDGETMPYVDATPACSTASDADHRQTIHSPSGIKAFIRINPNVFDRRVPRHRMTKLYTTLMHEYAHFQQFVAEGLHAHTVFARQNHPLLGDIEELQATRGGQENILEALQEIDAASAEIENARRTGLNVSFDIRHTTNYLWEHYQRYKVRRGANNIDANVAARVYDNIEAARRLLAQYLSNPRYEAEIERVYPQPRLRQWLLNNCPEVKLGVRYDPAAMQREIAAARARARTGSSR